MKLLIIEDSEKLRKSLVKAFTRLGFTVDQTGDGKEGLSYALVYDYNLIILDILLPSLDGISILRQLRGAKKKSNILILSARAQVSDRINGLNLGADDYLCKPFSFEELHARVITLVRRSYRLKTNLVTIRGVCLDIELKIISVGDIAISFTPIEYSIVELLMLNTDRVMSVEQLLDNVVESNAAPTKNAIEAHVSSIRRKLKQVNVSDLIETRRGFGYAIRN